MKKISGILLCVSISILNSFAAASPGSPPLNFAVDDLYITVATPAIPAVSTGGPSSITDSSLQFNGNVNPNSSPTDAWFVWGLTTAYGDTTAPQPMGSGTALIPFSQNITGLPPHTLYHYRAIAVNGVGGAGGGDRSATTLAIPPSVSTLSVSSVSLSSAMLHASANPNNSSSSGYFEWGPDTSYGNSTSTQSLGSGLGAVNFNQTISGLLPNTTYHYRAVAVNSAGTTHGSDQIVATLKSLNEYQPDTNTIALYHFNESEGTFVRDYSGNGLHGTATSEDIGEGRYGNARHYNLSSDDITVGSNPLLDTPETLTAEAWISPLLGGFGDLFIAGRGNPDSTNFSWALIALRSRQLKFVLNDSVGGRFSVVSVDSPLTDGVWHHVAAVVRAESSIVRLYYDGAQMTTVPSGTFNHLLVPTGSLSIGLPPAGPAMPPRTIFHSPSSSELFHCGIDEVRLSRIARQPSEFVVNGVIRGTAFHDLNANGARDNGEPVLNGWTILLSGTSSGSAHTDANGAYAFTNLLPGSYTVSESSQTGWTQTLPPSNGSYSVTMSPGFDTSGLDFGNFVPSVSVKKGWNMVSLPVTVSDSNVTSIFPSAISSAFAYGNTGYSVVSKLQNRPGYWLKFANDEIVPVPGSPRLTDTLGTIDSWNLVGSISNAIPVSAITTDPPGGTVPPLFGYSGSYTIVDSVKPGNGYWAKLTAPMRLVLDGSIAAPKIGSAASELASLNTITFTDAAHSSQTLYFGNTNGEALVNRYELPPVPPQKLFDVRFGSDHLVEALQSGGEKKIILQGITFPLTVSWKINDARTQFSLTGNNGNNIQVSQSGTATLDHPPAVLTLRGSGGSLPSDYSLRQNFPNPFNPSTVIRYQIPVEAYVTLKVYNMVGQQVAVLVDELQPAGFKETEFNALALPSGVYSYVLKAGDFREMKSMVLVK